MLIEIDRASFGYRRRPVVRVNGLHLHAGRCLGIFGPNGAGKTTLVRGLTGLLSPMSGTVRRHQSPIRFGYLPQHRALDLHWPMTGFDAASLAISATRRFGWLGGAGERVRRSMQTLDVLSLASRSFAELSGGQQQRLLLAGALASSPEVLVLDEPTDGLDIRSRRDLLELLQQVKANGMATVVISHDVDDLAFLADEIAWVEPSGAHGEPSVVECLTPADLVARTHIARRPG